MILDLVLAQLSFVKMQLSFKSVPIWTLLFCTNFFVEEFSPNPFSCILSDTRALDQQSHLIQSLSPFGLTPELDFIHEH